MHFLYEYLIIVGKNAGIIKNTNKFEVNAGNTGHRFETKISTFLC